MEAHGDGHRCSDRQTFGLVGSETQEVQHFAEFGVVMMLFLVGLELEPRLLWQKGWTPPPKDHDSHLQQENSN